MRSDRREIRRKCIIPISMHLLPTTVLTCNSSLLFHRFVNSISIEVLERGTFTDVMSVWRTYTNSYPACEPSLKDLASFGGNTNEGTADNEAKKTLWLIVSVIDKGIGINAEDLKKLGTAFTQLSQGRQKKYQG